MRGLITGFMGVLVGLAMAVSVGAEELSALARFDPAGSVIRDEGDAIVLRLSISQPVPYRIGVMVNPPRLVLDFKEVDWARQVSAELSQSDHVLDMRAGLLRSGWSRMVLELDGPWKVDEAEMRTGNGGAAVHVTLRPTSEEEFATRAAALSDAGWALPKGAKIAAAKTRQTGEAPLVVVIDPGHGGIDPGAERDGLSEAELMLTFARELKEHLIRMGRMTVVLTREEDAFVPLETRISIARAAGADLFLSLHADALAEGRATGATVYTLAKEASDAASAALAERHDRADLLAGVDLTEQDDLIAGIMMDMARTETTPRSERLADALVAGIKGQGLRMHKRPRHSAGFSVLKSPDIPSVLLELGFLSSEVDLSNLRDAEWRAKMAEGIGKAIEAWALEDAAEAALLRQ